jgi:CrcB protein
MTGPARLYAAVGLGSALGAVARYLVSTWTVAALGAGFPWGTLAVNVLGAFLIGLYATLTGPDGRLMVSPALRQFVMSGFCGGFTTFSIFSLETIMMLERQDFRAAGINLGLSVVSWMLAVWLGHRAAVRLNRLKGT